VKLYKRRLHNEETAKLINERLEAMRARDQEFFYLYRSVEEAQRVAATLSQELGIEVERLGSALRMERSVEEEISLKFFIPSALGWVSALDVTVAPHNHPAPVVSTQVSAATFSRDCLEK
jgi:hypothetical protein